MLPRVTNTVIAICTGFFLLTMATESFPEWAFTVAGLTSGPFFGGAFWLPFTYFLIHSDVLSFVAHMLAIIYFGRIIEVRLGTMAYTKLVALVIVIPGLVYVAFEPITGQISLLESTPLAIGLLSALCMLEPNRPLSIFFVPLPLRIVLLIVIIVLAFLQIGFLLTVTAHLTYMSALFLGIIFTRQWVRKNSIYTRGWNPQRRY